MPDGDWDIAKAEVREQMRELDLRRRKSIAMNAYNESKVKARGGGGGRGWEIKREREKICVSNVLVPVTGLYSSVFV